MKRRRDSSRRRSDRWRTSWRSPSWRQTRLKLNSTSWSPSLARSKLVSTFLLYQSYSFFVRTFFVNFNITCPFTPIIFFQVLKICTSSVSVAVLLFFLCLEIQRYGLKFHFKKKIYKELQSNHFVS